VKKSFVRACGLQHPFLCDFTKIDGPAQATTSLCHASVHLLSPQVQQDGSLRCGDARRLASRQNRQELPWRAVHAADGWHHHLATNDASPYTVNVPGALTVKDTERGRGLGGEADVLSAATVSE
jgi:hypothetical protein